MTEQNQTPPWGDDANFDASKAWSLIQNLRAEVDGLKTAKTALAAERDDALAKAQDEADALARVRAESEQAVKDAKPNLDKIRQLAEKHKVSTAITAENLDVTLTSTSQDYDYIARYFAPHKGINEDPVTGSMHTGLAPLWAEKLGKTSLIAYQASSRGGLLYCDIQSETRIQISGYAKLYMTAELYLD